MTLRILVGALILIGLAWAAVFGTIHASRRLHSEIPEAKQSLEDFTSDLVQKDYKGAFGIASPSFRERISYKDMLANHAKLNAEFGALKGVKQNTWTLSNMELRDIATIDATLEFERSSEHFQFILRKEDDIWRVVSYRDVGAAGKADE